MITLSFWTALIIALVAPGRAPSPASKRITTGEVAPINAVVGDASWVDRHGHAPTPHEAQTRDDERHRVHLAWIERKLRARPVDHLAPEQRLMRAVLLDALRDYRLAGVHPVNERAERRPRFLDRDGRICAVGHLIEVSRGRELVERINERWEYDDLLDIHDPELDAWIAESGFTARELASIQPTGVAGGDPLVALSIGIGGPVLAGGDIAFLAAGKAYGSRGLPDGLAILELSWGAVHLLSLALFAEEVSEATGITAAIASAIGIGEIVHAIWSLTSAEPERPAIPLCVGLSATSDGAVLIVAGVM